MNSAVTKERRSQGLRVITPKEVATQSRAVTSEPIASGISSSSSVDSHLSVLMSLPMLRRTKGSSKVSSKCRHKIELRKFR